MEYIVSAEDTPYYHWQLELLIESFKRHGLQDKLVIALASRDVPRNPNFTKNLSGHPRIVAHDNVGRKRGYPYLNKPYAVSTAVNQNKIAQPFTVIEPDMLLYRPIPVSPEPISFQIKHSFTLQAAEEKLPTIRKYISEATSGRSDGLWLPLGSVYSFHDVPADLFGRAVSWSEILAFESSMENKKNGLPLEYWKLTERAGWVLAFLNYQGHLPYNGTHQHEMSLMDSYTHHHFIHYSDGLPPVFSKCMFRYEPPVYFAGAETPFASMLRETPTSTAFYLQEVVRSYLGT